MQKHWLVFLAAVSLLLALAMPPVAVAGYKIKSPYFAKLVGGKCKSGYTKMKANRFRKGSGYICAKCPKGYKFGYSKGRSCCVKWVK